MEGRLTGFSLTPDGGCQNITVTVAADFRETYDELKDGLVDITIKKATKHRSLEANRYAWTLIDQIAAKIHEKRRDVYRKAILDIGGVSKDMFIKADALPVFTAIWEKQGLGNQVEVVDTEDETGWCSIRVFFGSSTYDTAQMSTLLDSLIQEAESLGIPTITPKEEERMLGRWAKKWEGKDNDSNHSGEHHTGTGRALPEAECG